jgi:hypothetical protein
VYKDKTKKQLLVHVPMAKTKIFPLNFAGEKQARKASFLDEAASTRSYNHPL